ncbi:zinc finger protein 585A [Orussus abietinus]|uniref:zinc finger protein 585A n=1 Tax=Orussus abietinus TaxID=222816 RepID=UPI000626ABCE|nr:zinc finger protein 585A [Orussus abietinus]XP_012273166.1 zinc finger protein 585A [Orussus abietinus]XP_012273167.1 zinc finger protein 585A [Orussus abietinus]XP_012273168.1 zinc finger protein 585A [Orussus abietinus]
METHENEQYVTFPLTGVHEQMQDGIISHEEICEPVEECVLREGLTEVSVRDVNSGISETQVAVEILADRSDEEDENSVVYPIYIKQEEQQQYTSGDDESMAVEALRQLGGMYPCFEDKKIGCPNCSNLFTQSEMAKHHGTCTPIKLTCTTCGERFERKIDLTNHVVCHQMDRPHSCRTCGNLFRSKANLQSHMAQVHQIERPHKCTICGADFQRPSSLSNHMKIHSYVAGRAIMQAQTNNVTQSVESFRKWPENTMSDSQNNTVHTSSVQTIQNYDVSQVHWSVPSYNFHSEQTNVSSIPTHQEKMGTMHEFTVMPNGEVTQFEFTQQTAMASQINPQYNLSLNSFNNQDSMVKVETLPYSSENRRNYTEIDVTETKNHTCSHCGVNFSRATALASHEKIHTSKTWGMPIECEYCDKQFQDANHLAAHQTTCAKKMMQNNIEQGVPNNKWGKHACSECGKKFTTKQKMFRHQWIHRKKTHSCEVCGSQFEKQNQLDEHRLSAHPGDSPFTCSECGKSFVSRQGLWEHGRTHAGSPAHFHCDTCSKTFSSRQGYLIHHRTHTGERPYGCKFCWKAFRDGGTLRKHERIHTGERPHVCPLCSRAFNQKVVLREHVRWVHAAGKNETEVTGPPFPCPLCGALNQDRDELCAHIVKHSDQMIAEAKAKTNNNSPKPKPPKKKTKSVGIAAQAKSVSGNRMALKNEQTEALLSITEPAEKNTDNRNMTNKQTESLLLSPSEKRNESMHIMSEKPNNVRLISENKNETAHISQRNHGESLNLIAIEKRGTSAHLVSSVEANNVIHTIASRHGDTSSMHLISTSKQSDSLHLIPTNKQSNTLHLISKQNEALPVLAIPNPQSHENFSSQIAQISNADVPMNMVTHHSSRQNQQTIKQQAQQESLIHEGSQQPAVIHVVQYHQQESDDGEELVCGICGDDFHDKDVLMEHVKIHI